MKKDKKYEDICKKLGFIPSELEDNFKNPFSVLSADEIIYLYENGYLTKSN